MEVIGRGQTDGQRVVEMGSEVSLLWAKCLIFPTLALSSVNWDNNGTKIARIVGIIKEDNDVNILSIVV